MAKKRTFSVELELSDVQLAVLDERIKLNMPLAAKVCGLAQASVGDQADGGRLLLPGIVRQLETALGGDWADDQQLVAAIEKSRSMDQGRLVGKWMVDPTYLAPLQEIALNQGLSVDEVVQSLMDYACSQGWAYQVDVNVRTAFFSRDDFTMIAELLGKPRNEVNGSDIAAYFRRQLEPPSFEPVAIDQQLLRS